MQTNCEDYFSERDLFLMKEALNAGTYYDSLGDWLEEVIADGGYIVAQHLAHDADELNSLNHTLPWFTRMYNSGYQAGHHDTVEGGFTDVHQTDKDTYHEDVVTEILEELNEEYNSDGGASTGKMSEHEALAITRNPYGVSEDKRREARLLICEKMETYREAYLNMRDWAESQGVDTRAYG